MTNRLKRDFDSTLNDGDGTCDPLLVSRIPSLPITDQWGPPNSRSLDSPTPFTDATATNHSGAHRLDNPTSTSPKPRSLPEESTKYIEPGYCYASNPSHPGETHYGFYIPPKTQGYTTVLCALGSEYDEATKTLGISQQLFFPVRSGADIENWTVEKRKGFMKSMNTAYQGLETERKLSKCLCDGVADGLALTGGGETLRQTMNSLWKIEKVPLISGIYSVRFGEAKVQDSMLSQNKPYDTDASVIKPSTSKRNISLPPYRQTHLRKAIASGSVGPTKAVSHCTWGTEKMWTLGE